MPKGKTPKGKRPNAKGQTANAKTPTAQVVFSDERVRDAAKPGADGHGRAPEAPSSAPCPLYLYARAPRA